VKVRDHDHQHALNRFAVIPTAKRLNADPQYTGRGMTIAFLDSGFYPHPDLTETVDRIIAYEDLAGEQTSLDAGVSETWHWHGTQTSVTAAGNGHLSDGIYRGLASQSNLVLVKVSESGRITEENIARGIDWVIANRQRYNIRVLNISLGGDEDVPCSTSLIDQAAEEAIRQGIVVVVAAGNSSDRRSIPPANSPSVITVGGYHDNNRIGGLDLYHSSFGATADGVIKPEIVAPAMWVAAPLLPGTAPYERAEALSRLMSIPDYELPHLARELEPQAALPESLKLQEAQVIRNFVEDVLNQEKIVGTHYQHVDGTSFAAPIVTSIVALMLEANPGLTPAAVKNILLSTADRISNAPAIRQGYGVINAGRAVELAKQETHSSALTGFGPPRIQNGELLFAYHNDEATEVAVAGDFNGWSQSETTLRKSESGLWLAEVKTPVPGRYQYKFVVDGHRWIEDPNNGMKVADGYGGLNSLLVIE
jgi:serine protease AprX